MKKTNKTKKMISQQSFAAHTALPQSGYSEILIALIALMSYVAHRQPRVLKQNRLHKSDITEIAAQIPYSAEMIELLFAICLQLGLIHPLGKRYHLESAAVKAFYASPGKGYAKLLAAYIKLVSAKSAMSAERDHLRALFVKDLKKRIPSKATSVSAILQQYEKRARADGYSDDDTAQRFYLWLDEEIIPLGIADYIAAGQRDAMTVKLSKAAHSIFIKKSYPKNPFTESAFTILPNFDIIVPNECTLSTRMILSLIAKKKASNTFSLSRDTLFVGLENDITPDAIKAFLVKNNAAAVPDNVMQFIDDCAVYWNSVHIGSAHAYISAPPMIITEIESLKKCARLIQEKISDSVLLLTSADAVPECTKILKQYGIHATYRHTPHTGMKETIPLHLSAENTIALIAALNTILSITADYSPADEITIKKIVDAVAQQLPEDSDYRIHAARKSEAMMQRLKQKMEKNLKDDVRDYISKRIPILKNKLVDGYTDLNPATHPVDIRKLLTFSVARRLSVVIKLAPKRKGGTASEIIIHPVFVGPDVLLAKEKESKQQMTFAIKKIEFAMFNGETFTSR